MKNDDYLAKGNPTARAATYLGQAITFLIFGRVESDPQLVQWFHRLPRMSSLDVQGIEIQDGVMVYNDNYVLNLVPKFSEDVSVLAAEILALYPG